MFFFHLAAIAAKAAIIGIVIFCVLYVLSCHNYLRLGSLITRCPYICYVELSWYFPFFSQPALWRTLCHDLFYFYSFTCPIPATKYKCFSLMPLFWDNVRSSESLNHFGNIFNIIYVPILLWKIAAKLPIKYDTFAPRFEHISFHLFLTLTSENSIISICMLSALFFPNSGNNNQILSSSQFLLCVLLFFPFVFFFFLFGKNQNPRRTRTFDFFKHHYFFRPNTLSAGGVYINFIVPNVSTPHVFR